MQYVVFSLSVIIVLSIILLPPRIAATTYSEPDLQIRNAQLWITYREKCDLTCHVETYYYLVGEVVNLGNEPVNVRLSFMLNDERGNLFYIKEFAPFLSWMMQNGTRNSVSPFRIDLDDVRSFHIIGARDLETFEESKARGSEPSFTYEVKVAARYPAYEKPAVLDVEEIRKFVDDDKRLHILGKVNNTGSNNATNVNIIYTFYDEEGRVVWAGKYFLDKTGCSSYPAILGEVRFCFGGLASNTSVPFEIVTEKSVSYVIKYWSILAESDWQSTIPEFPLFAMIIFAIAVSSAFVTKLKPELQLHP